MKSLDEFKELYKRVLYAELLKLEEVRKAQVNKILMICGPILVLSILVFLATFMSWEGDGPSIILVVGFLLCTGAYFYLTRGYVAQFKGVVIEKIVEFMDPTLKYDRADRISQSEFVNSGIFNQYPDRYSGDDRVTGKIDATAIDFSEVHARYRTRNNKGCTRYHTFFKGLFFVGDFHKDFKGKTFVLPDSAEKSFGIVGKWMQSKNISRPPLVSLEDPEFERKFVVYGTDQVEARYILSTSLMKRILDFKQRTGRNVYFSFVDSKVYVAIYYKRNLFEPKVFSTLLDFAPIQQYYDDLSLATGIVEDLNLNTRIWSKQ